MKVKPARLIKGTVGLPGDKSISHRAALIAAMAHGPSPIKNFSSSQDCASTLKCLSQLSVAIRREGQTLIIEGVGPTGFKPSLQPLDCGNSGSTMRMLAGILAGQDFATVLTGDSSLRTRPMSRITEPLERMGAVTISENGCAPLQIIGSQPLSPIKFELAIASAQVKTCVLFAGMLAHGPTVVLETGGATRDHTERMLQWFGVPLEVAASAGTRSCAVAGPVEFNGREVTIPGDFSAAAYLIAAAALLPGSELEIKGVGLNPTRTHFLDVLRAWGMPIEVNELRDVSNEPVGSIRVKGISAEKHLEGSKIIEGHQTAALIDELPLLAIVGSQMPGGVVVREAGELRTKESDRIAATVLNLRLMGAEVEEFENGFRVTGPTRLKSAAINPSGDHRIAMAFTVGALVADGESEIMGEESVAISFPDFFERLESVVER